MSFSDGDAYFISYVLQVYFSDSSYVDHTVHPLVSKYQGLFFPFDSAELHYLIGILSNCQAFAIVSFNTGYAVPCDLVLHRLSILYLKEIQVVVIAALLQSLVLFLYQET